MSARYYNLMPRTPENDRIRKTLEVYDLKRNTSEPTYYLKHTVPSGVNKIKGGMCNCGDNNRMLDRPIRQVLHGGSLPEYMTADDMDTRGMQRKPPGGVLDTKMSRRMVKSGTMVRYPGYNMNEQKVLDDMEGGMLGSLVSMGTRLGSSAAQAAAAAARAAAQAAAQAGRIAMTYGPQILQAGLEIANHPQTQQIVNSPQFQQLSDAAMQEAMRRFSGGKMLQLKNMEGGSMFSTLSNMISSGAKTAATVATQATKLASAAALESAKLAAQHGPAVLQAGIDLYNSPQARQVLDSPQFKSLAELAMDAARKKITGGKLVKLKGLPKKGGGFGPAISSSSARAAADAPRGGRFPARWGAPPRMQTADLRTLPGGYGMGSSTLARWITEKMAADTPEEAAAEARAAEARAAAARARAAMAVPNSPEFRQLSDAAMADAMRRLSGGSFFRDISAAPGAAARLYRAASARGGNKYPALEKAMKGSGRRSERAEIVKSVMKEQGLSLPMASKYVKEHNLY